MHKCFEISLQTFLVLFICTSAWICEFEIAIQWLIYCRKRSYIGIAYFLLSGSLFTILLLLLLGLFTGVWQSRAQHLPLPDAAALIKPYECSDITGALANCHDENCTGSWRPPRCHHCRKCGVCRMGFDHHCPFLGTCVTFSNLPSFFALLILTPATFLLAVLPALPRLRQHVGLALTISRTSDWARSVWWDQMWSWIVIGGPLGRWPVGVILGFLILRRHQNSAIATLPGDMVEKPNLGVFLLTGFGLFISLFCTGLAVAVLNNVLSGRTTLEAIRPKRDGRFLCIPNGDPCLRCICHIPYPLSERLYDLGWRQNLARVFRYSGRGHNSLPQRNTATDEWYPINSQILQWVTMVGEGKKAV